MVSRCRVKICGITSVADAESAVRAGTDAIGLVFYPPSPRHVEPDRAAEIVGSLPPFVTPVGVFVDQPVDEIRALCQRVCLPVAQVHGELSPSGIHQLREDVRVVAGLRLSSAGELSRWRSLGPADAFLFDTHVPGELPGGTGRAFPWEWLETGDRPPVTILAGGLRPDNVAEAITRVRPFAVDVSSGVESQPGKKSLALLEAFLAAVRSVS